MSRTACMGQAAVDTSPVRAVVADPGTRGALGIEEMPGPVPAADEAIVAVSSFSLNAGEVRRALHPDGRWRPGWDLAGVVVQAAGDGSGPPAGSRVVGFAGMAGGGWAERVAVRTTQLATVPAGVSPAQAACLPVAGMTALFALEKRGQLLGRSVLVTGASGGVGRFACRLAVLSGATVVGSVRSGASAAPLRADGVHDVVVGDEEAAATFDLVVECVGGSSLARSMTRLVRGGMCVVCGNASEGMTAFQARDFYMQGEVSLHGFYLGHALANRAAAPALSHLLELVRNGSLRVPIMVEASWRDLPSVARRFHDRDILGKAVLHVDDAGGAS